MKTQLQMVYEASARLAAGNETMLELLFGANPITDDELRLLIAKYPSRYKRFAGYLGKRTADPYESSVTDAEYKIAK